MGSVETLGSRPRAPTVAGVTAASQDRPTRLRRRPADAEAEIVAAAEELLREGSYADLSVAEVMGRTSLGRSSFYVYFPDLPALVGRLISRFSGELFDVAAIWLDGDADRLGAARRALDGVVAVWVRHGPLLRALTEAAVSDPGVERLYRVGMVEHFVDAVSARVAEDVALGRIDRPLSREVTRALLCMNGDYLRSTMGRTPQEDPRVVADTLYTVWTRVLYGADPA